MKIKQIAINNLYTSNSVPWLPSTAGHLRLLSDNSIARTRGRHSGRQIQSLPSRRHSRRSHPRTPTATCTPCWLLLLVVVVLRATTQNMAEAPLCTACGCRMIRCVPPRSSSYRELGGASASKTAGVGIFVPVAAHQDKNVTYFIL